MQRTTIRLPDTQGGAVRVVPSSWDDGFYLLDELRLEVVSIDRNGTLRHRFGGWGESAGSLDFPVDLAVGENSVFVLDQGRHQIVRLDARLNPVAATPLPEDRLATAFVRDAQLRFWVIFENFAGLQIYGDNGDLLDVVADEGSGSAAVFHPEQLAASRDAVAAWDPVEGAIFIFYLSGQLQRRLPIGKELAFADMVWVAGKILLAGAGGLWEVDTRDGVVSRVYPAAGIIDLAYRAPALYGLSRIGAIHVFHAAR
ncbi:MAG: hypothetical protein IH971_04000 [Candidatus Marinimicrobia bacterium]|nr:hypothetical protein [Candidatus Neomarinimicrobiota bacterium]